MLITIKNLYSLPKGYYKLVKGNGDIENILYKYAEDNFNHYPYYIIGSHYTYSANNIESQFRHLKIIALDKPENSEYAGNSRNGQSAGIDLTEIATVYKGSPSQSGDITHLQDKVDELVRAVNKLNKPSETTKEQPLFTNTEIEVLKSCVGASLYSMRLCEILKDKLNRLKV